MNANEVQKKSRISTKKKLISSKWVMDFTKNKIDIYCN